MMLMVRIAICFMLFNILQIGLYGQTINFQSGISIRNNQESHYYKMVSWDDTDYKEFAYWKESATGSVIEFMNWRGVFPVGYDNSGNTNYPMIIMMHGAGESGRKWTDNFNYSPSDPEYDNNGKNLVWGGKVHLNAVKNGTFPGIVIFPQSSYNASWDADDRRMLAGIVEYMISTYHANPFQITVHGLSNGAKGCWEFANYRPDLISSLLPMSGVGSDIDGITNQLLTTPIWLFQGGQDTNPSPGAAENWIEELQEKGGKPRYTFYQDNDHNTWVDAYNEPDFFSWILDRDKRNIFVFGDTSNLYITENGKIDLGFSAGYLQYQWKRDGQPISGTNSRYYTADQPGTYTVAFLQPINDEWGESFPLEIEAYSGEPIVYIPDPQFKNVLLNNTSINTNQDGQIQVAEANAFSGQINANSSNISDLTGIEAFTNITDLRVHYNHLTSIDLNNNGQLSQLHCQGNQLESLDVSHNTKLNKLRCFDNNLVSLNIKNGNNHNFGLFQAYNNDLTCIQVDNVPYAEANWSDDVDSGVEFRTECGGSIVFIPDANFKNALVSNSGINTSGDDEIQYSEANDYTGNIDVSNQQIGDLTGIEAFASIQAFNFSDNNVNSLDLSENTLVEEVYGSNNQLSSVELGSNSNLTTLRLDNNSLIEINLSQAASLNEIQVQFNQLSHLDLSNNTQVVTIYCNDNDLQSFNLKNNNNQQIATFEARNNALSCIQVSDVNYAETNWSDNVDQGVEFSTSCGGSVVNLPDQNFKDALLAITGLNTNGDNEIQISEAQSYNGTINVNSSNISDITGIEKFTSLTDLRVHNNNISSINLSSNTELIQLHCQKNNLNSLDISGNTKIKKLRCFSNELTSLNIQNGNNKNFDLFDAYDNNLSCIQVDDVAYAEANWSGNVDPGVEFSTDCSGSASVRVASADINESTEILQEQEEQILIYPNPFSNQLKLRFSDQKTIENFSFRIFDIRNGSILNPRNISYTGNEAVADLSNLTSGYYLIQVGNVIYRIIKED